MGECLVKNMIKEANFLSSFADSSQMMLKLGRNIRWVEILWNFKKIDGVISDSKVWRHNRHFHVATTNKVESLHWFFVCGWSKLKLDVRGNFWLLISNLDSKMQYQFEILRKMPLFFFSILIFNPALPQAEFVTMAWMTCLQSFSFKRYCRWLP